MKISYNWLRQYIDLELSPEETGKLLTDCGLEVESVEKQETVKGGLEGLVIGEVKTKSKHPDADRLSLTTVDIGTGTDLNIVCGAQNVAAGQKVVVATIGATIYPSKGEPITMKKAKIRGALSEGMICAEDEIGLGTSHDGILVLDPSAKTGTPAKEYFKIESDYLIEIGLTPNRADAASHIGVAKDLYCLLNWTLAENKYELQVPSVNEFSSDSEGLQISKANKTGNIEVAVEDAASCPRYSGVSIKGIKVSESPAWLKQRLTSIGLKPINNIVDITNFVLHETGQPLHAFDAAKIKGNKVIVKKCQEGTKFITLDNAERSLSSDDLMICDSKDPMCIAGVFGGIHSGVSETTTDLFLESAYFSAGTIRRSGKRHGLKTDASFRFERGADPNITLYALQRAALMIRELAGGTIAPEVVDIYPATIEEKKIALSFHHCDRLIGKALDRNQVRRILELLGMEIVSAGQDALLVSVPTNRSDISQEVDLIEEVIRIYGYNNIEIPSVVHSSLSHAESPDREKLRNTISDLLCGMGFTEIMANSLTQSGYLELLPSAKGQEVELLNPLSPELNILRPTLLFSGLEAIAWNQNRKNNDLKLYEFGKCYRQTEDELQETSWFTLFMTGNRHMEHWKEKTTPIDFYSIKSAVGNILSRLGISNVIATEISDETITNGLNYSIGKKKLARFGWVNKSILRKMDIRQEVFFAELNWENLVGTYTHTSVRFREIPKFPTVRRDLALVVDKNTRFETLRTIAFHTEQELLRAVNLFDVYEGDKIESGKKSYALSFILLNDNATLTDKEVEDVMNRLISAYKEKAGAKIRS